MQNPIVKTELGPGRSPVRRTQGVHPGGDIGGETLPRRLRHVRTVVEVVAADVRSCRAAEVVDREGVHASLGEPQRQLLEERVEAAHVRQDQHPGSRRLGGTRMERREPVAVGGGQGRARAVERAAGDRRDGRVAVEIEAHGSGLGAASGVGRIVVGGEIRAGGGPCRRCPQPVSAAGVLQAVSAASLEASPVGVPHRDPIDRRTAATSRCRRSIGAEHGTGDRGTPAERPSTGPRRSLGLAGGTLHGTDRATNGPRTRATRGRAVECAAMPARPGPRGPRPSSSRNTVARPSPTPTASSGWRGASRVSARRATTSSSSSAPWATRPTSCSAWPRPSPTTPIRASSTSCSPRASTRRRRCSRWPSTPWASARSA